MQGADQRADAEEHVAAWARSGAMALTGPADGPGLGPPAPLVPRLRAVADLLTGRAAALGAELAVDPLAVLTERAAVAGLRRRSPVSCGGGTRLLPTADGWLAVALPRPSDVELVPAWLGAEADPADPWSTVEPVVAARPTVELVAQGRLLGLPLGPLPPEPPAPAAPPAPLAPLPVRAERLGEAAALRSLEGVLVADLSALWAGPLCGALLADAGATVVKVESTTRPDGAREGPAALFDRLNAGKRSVALDVTTERGRAQLRALVATADVVISSSRPRALTQLGVHPEQVLYAGRTRAWVSITGHGRTGDAADAVGFGDDAAVAGGLVVWDADRPHLCADAVADPTSGLVAAAATLDALTVGGRWLLDVALARTAAHLAGPTLPVPPATVFAEPAPPADRGRAAPLGADTDEMLAALPVGP